MTDADRLLDRLLSEDGARWRAAQPAAPDPDPALFTRSRRARWQPLAAAAAVVLVAAGAVGLSAARRSADPPPAAASPGAIVRDGDRVAGQGTVIARPGEAVQLCLVEPVLDTVFPPPVPSCRVGVTVTGLDLDRLSDRQERDGKVWGSARVEGVYRARTLAVSRQEAFRQPPRDDISAPDAVPCPEPAGGWPRPPADLSAALSRLNRAVSKHAAEYTDPYVRYPYGWHLQDQSGGKGIEVYVVGTTGDVAAARRELERVFPARHLCVTRASWSRDAMAVAVKSLMRPEARAAGVGTPFADTVNDRVTATIVVLDEAASRFLAGVADGRVIPEPMLAKLR